jgi:hypothetical protein
MSTNDATNPNPNPDSDASFRAPCPIGRGAAAWSSGGAADSASAPTKPMEEALTARTQQRLSTDPHPAPKPSPLLADHEPV